MSTERWELVPAEATPEILNAFPSNFGARIRYAEILAASPGAALLAEVLAARDALNSDIRAGEMIGDYINRKSTERTALLAALDKLGPAQTETNDGP